MSVPSEASAGERRSRDACRGSLRCLLLLGFLAGCRDRSTGQETTFRYWTILTRLLYPSGNENARGFLVEGGIRIDTPPGSRYSSSMAAERLTDIQIREGVCRSFARFNPHKIILFGSHGRGDADEESDIDLIIVYETHKRFLDRLRELYMAWSLPKGVDILAYTPQEFAELSATRPFIQDAVAGGKVIYERE
jgi:predicted nucleotidyltransferase